MLLSHVSETMGAGVADYVRILVGLLQQAGIKLSPRRAGMLYRSVLATYAAALTLNPGNDPAESALLAVTTGLPQRAQGIPVPEVKVLAAHKEAWRPAKMEPDDPVRAIMTATDPVDRLRLAVGFSSLKWEDFSGVVADVLAQLPAGAREAGIVFLFETGAVGRLNAAVAEDAAAIYQKVATQVSFSESLHAADRRFPVWQRLKNLLSRLDPANDQHKLQANAVASIFARGEITSTEDADAIFTAFAATRARLEGRSA